MHLIVMNAMVALISIQPIVVIKPKIMIAVITMTVAIGQMTQQAGSLVQKPLQERHM